MGKKIFDYINALNAGEWMEVDKTYEPFLVTRFFSYFVDTALIANEANQYNSMNKQAHFDFYFGLVSKKKRFTKWFKSEKSEAVKCVSEFFELAHDKAVEIMDLLNEDQINEIEQWYDEKEKL